MPCGVTFVFTQQNEIISDYFGQGGLCYINLTEMLNNKTI